MINDIDKNKIYDSFLEYIVDNQRKLMISLPNIYYNDDEEYDAVFDDFRTIIKEYISQIFAEDTPRLRHSRSHQLSPQLSPRGGRSPQLSPRF